MTLRCLLPFVLLASLGSCSSLEHRPAPEPGLCCTEIGCRDHVAISLRTGNGTWPDGAYELTLLGSGTLHRCAMNLPKDFPALGSVSELSCEPPLGSSGATLEQDAECQEQRSAGMVSQSCTPLPNQFTLSLSIQGTPERTDAQRLP